jgi:hypothetical protein
MGRRLLPLLILLPALAPAAAPASTPGLTNPDGSARPGCWTLRAQLAKYER